MLLLYNEARNSLDFSIARRGEEQARSSHRMAVSAHRLNLLAAFFFPIATLTALFGVNLRHGLETGGVWSDEGFGEELTGATSMADWCLRKRGHILIGECL